MFSQSSARSKLSTSILSKKGYVLGHASWIIFIAKTMLSVCSKCVFFPYRWRGIRYPCWKCSPPHLRSSPGVNNSSSRLLLTHPHSRRRTHQPTGSLCSCWIFLSPRHAHSSVSLLQRSVAGWLGEKQKLLKVWLYAAFTLKTHVFFKVPGWIALSKEADTVQSGRMAESSSSRWRWRWKEKLYTLYLAFILVIIKWTQCKWF